MFKQVKYSLVLILLLVLGACSSDSDNGFHVDPEEEIKSEKVFLLHLNDLHANINNFPAIAAYVNSLREENDNVFLLSAGDLFSGDPVVDQYEKPGYPMIHLMNELQFDLAVLGNHEFDYGQKVLNERMADANFPFICANIDASNAVLNQPDAYKKLNTKGGFELFVLGVVETGTKINDDRYIPSTHPDKVEGINFPYYKYTIGDYTKYKSDDNLFVLLSHLGQGSDVKMADQYSELDLIIGGHSHSVIDKPYVQNNALICQAGSKGRYIGQIEIDIEDGKVLSKKAKLVAVSDLSQVDAGIESIVNDYNNNPVLERVIAYNETDLYDKDELGALMCDAINWKVNTDMSFQNSGGIRSSLSKGDIKVKDVYHLDPFNNEVVVFEMSYAEIISLVKSSGSGDLKVSGINIRYTNNKPVLEDYDGNKLDQQKNYKVGLSSYIASAYKFDHANAGKNANITTATCLIEFLEFKQRINYEGVRHVFQ
jgi:2',3'-cyclic-nucleotide 2'-phosphodiesterase (5'-nucleotidase family)